VGTITKGAVACAFTVTKKNFFPLFPGDITHWLKIGAPVGLITKWLVFAQTTAAPEIGFTLVEFHILRLVTGDSRELVWVFSHGVLFSCGPNWVGEPVCKCNEIIISKKPPISVDILGMQA